ncbi:hypothetical protein VTJ04DRAFT_6934 [Mycothermus thermophilus]|uniref:uncharacterized protein n=1 Tax=Humicola insolens TaxID=85995 RepID=UPI003743AA74
MHLSSDCRRRNASTFGLSFCAQSGLCRCRLPPARFLSREPATTPVLPFSFLAVETQSLVLLSQHLRLIQQQYTLLQQFHNPGFSRCCRGWVQLPGVTDPISLHCRLELPAQSQTPDELLASALLNGTPSGPALQESVNWDHLSRLPHT